MKGKKKKNRSKPTQTSTTITTKKKTQKPLKGAFAVVLDGKRLRTPARNPLTLPTRALALAVAAEWASQSSSRVRPFTMPLMSLAATAIDEPAPREKVITTMLSYLHTDGALVREPPGTALAEEQERVFAPVVAWAERLAEKKTKTRKKKKDDDKDGKIAFVPSDSVRGAPQSDDAVAVVRDHLLSLDRWQLAAASQLAGAAKSVLLSLAALDDDDDDDGDDDGEGLKKRRKITLSEALVAARLEEDLQAAEWGVVEGGHDVDAAGCAVAVAAPVVFARLARVK